MAATGRYAAIGLTAAVITAVVAGLAILGSPVEERRLRMDEKRIADLQMLASVIDSYRARDRRFPASPGELEREGGGLRTRDPRTGRSYEYRVLDTVQYELCAHFERSSAEAGTDRAGFWYHGRGRTCFRMDAKKPSRF